MCCCVRTERAVHAPADAGCAPRSLAHRLRRIGDELEKRWAISGDNQDRNTNGDDDDKSSEETGRVSMKGLHLLCTAIQVTVLALFVGWRHL